MGVILAGGKSTRMGQDKACLIWKSDKTFLSHQMETLRQVVDEESLFVSGSRDGYKSIPDAEKECGPLEGVRSVLAELTKSNNEFWIYFVPVDMPFLRAEDLESLKINAGVEDAVIFANRNLPVLIRNPFKILRTLEEMKLTQENRNYSFKELYNRVDIKRIPQELNANMINLNTPEELKNALSKTNNPY